VGVEGRAMELRQRQAVRHDRLPRLLVGTHNDVSGIKQSQLGYMGNRAPSSVGGEDCISKRCLMQPGLNLAKRISTFGCVRWQCLGQGPHKRSKRKLAVGAPGANPR
jgi:hypothetical protein